MGWTLDWINIFHNGVDGSGNFAGNALTLHRVVEFEGRRKVRIQETSVGGAALFEFRADEPPGPDEIVLNPRTGPGDYAVSAYGMPKIYLAIQQDDNNRLMTRTLSAPVHTQIELHNLTRMELVIYVPLPAKLQGTNYAYRAGVNGHCIFESDDETRYSIGSTRVNDPPGWY